SVLRWRPDWRWCCGATVRLTRTTGDPSWTTGLHPISMGDRLFRRPGIVDLPVFDAVEPPGAQPFGFGQRGEIGHRVGDGVEHQVDGHPGQVGTDAVVRSGAAESDVRVRVAQDVERVRVVEDVLVE